MHANVHRSGSTVIEQLKVFNKELLVIFCLIPIYRRLRPASQKIQDVRHALIQFHQLQGQS